MLKLNALHRKNYIIKYNNNNKIINYYTVITIK